MLTSQQYKLLLFINDYLQKTGFSPSFDEMKIALGLRSKSGIHRLISGLEERGFLKRRHHRARALEVIRSPETFLSSDHFYSSYAIPKPVNGNNIVTLPLYGYIAAGLPIESLPDPEETIDIPASMLKNGTHFALTIKGESMIEAGIFDGDIVIIRKTDQAMNGQIVAALVEDEEVTLKEWHQRDHIVALKPANAAYEPRLYPIDKVKIQGILVSLLRTY